MTNREEELSWENFSSYEEQLQHEKWHEKRAEIISIQKRCQFCGTSDRLQVHHKRYIRGRVAWDYDNSNFELLCADCHEEKHIEEEVKRATRYFYKGRAWSKEQIDAKEHLKEEFIDNLLNWIIPIVLFLIFIVFLYWIIT